MGENKFICMEVRGEGRSGAFAIRRIEAAGITVKRDEGYGWYDRTGGYYVYGATIKATEEQAVAMGIDTRLIQALYAAPTGSVLKPHPWNIPIRPGEANYTGWILLPDVHSFDRDGVPLPGIPLLGAQTTTVDLAFGSSGGIAIKSIVLA